MSALSVLLSMAGRLIRNPRLHLAIRITLPIALVGNEFLMFANGFAAGRWTLVTGLPLNLCSLAVFVVSVALLTGRQLPYEVAYFWALAGTTQALATPDLGFTSRMHILQFFIGHGLVVVSVAYLTLGLKRRPMPGSVLRMVILTTIYAAFVGLFNWMFKTNYLFLCAKPEGASLMDHFGPWPVYLLVLEVVGILSFMICYAPFFFLDRARKLQQQGVA